MNSVKAKVIRPQGIPLNGSGPAIFSEQSSCLSVQVPLGFLKNWRLRGPGDQTRVWLLRRDGTMVPQLGAPFVFALGTAGNHATDYQFFSFSRTPADELASVVVSFHGKLYCHEISKA